MVKFCYLRLTTATFLSSLVFSGFLTRRVGGIRSVDELDSDFVVTEESETEPTVPIEDEDYQLEAGDSKYGTLTTPPVTPSSGRVMPYPAPSSTQMPNIIGLGSSTDVPVKPIPKLWGCYEYYPKGEMDKEAEHDSADKFSKCSAFCKEQSDWTARPLFMIRGAQCLCSPFEDFSRKRVDSQHCNLDCEPGNPDSVKCGGNLVLSVYCDIINFPDECTKDNEDPIEDLSTEPEENLPPELMPLQYVCAACATGFDCNIEGFRPEHDYFPENSAEECVRYCRSKVQVVSGTPNEIRVYHVAILRWWPNLHENRPVCMCDQSIEKYVEKPGECHEPCPGNAAEICGESTDRYTIYCAYPDCDLPVPGPGPGSSSTSQSSPTTTMTSTTEESSSFPTSSTLEPRSSSSETGSSSTSQSSPTTTMMSTTEESSSIPTSSTLEPRSSSSESRNSPIFSSTTESATMTTTRPSPSPTLSTTTTTTTEAPPTPGVCSVKCKETDHYGESWEGCPGEIVWRDCGNGKSGYGTWECLKNASFAGTGPDFSSCKSDWQDKFQDKIEAAIRNNETWSRSDAVKILGSLEGFCTPTDSIKVPYFGHEILKISEYVVGIIGLTNGSYREHEEIIRQALAIPQLLVMNEDPWHDLTNPSERANVTTKLFTMLEGAAFTLTRDDLPDKYSADFPSKIANSSDFLITFVSGNYYGSRPLQFPSNAESGTSFISMDVGWAAVANDSTYVGVSLDSKFIKLQMPPSRFTGPASQSTRNINSKMLSLTLAGGGSNLFGKSKPLANTKVRITFQHNVEAWGEKPAIIRRKLHPGEIPKMVLGGAACAFWSTQKLEWDTSGCEKINSSRTETICECNHLTSFALLMDQHKYVGKEKTLEVLTIALCSLSALALLCCIVAFTAIHSIKSSRTTITKHLCFCLMIGILMLLIFVDRDFIPLPDAVCTAVGIGTHYIYLAAFMWMLIEGFHLYKMVVHVFDSGKSPSTVYKVIAYGVPVLMVGATCVLGAVLKHQPYRGDEFCWLEGPYIWAFIGPVTVVIIINIIVLFIALKTAYQIQPKTAFLQKRRGDYRTWIRGSFSITVILGITWLPGLFMTSPSPIVGKVSAYLFVVLNASQGFLIFVHHCLLNEKVRRAAERSINFSSWLSRQSGHSKDFYQSGKRSENTIGRSTTTASVKSIKNPKGVKSNVQRNIPTLYGKGLKGTDLDSGKRHTSETRSRNKGSDSSQRDLVHR